MIQYRSSLFISTSSSVLYWMYSTILLYILFIVSSLCFINQENFSIMLHLLRWLYIPGYTSKNFLWASLVLYNMANFSPSQHSMAWLGWMTYETSFSWLQCTHTPIKSALVGTTQSSYVQQSISAQDQCDTHPGLPVTHTHLSERDGGALSTLLTVLMINEHIR